MAEAVKKAGIVKHASVHTLRHSFATHLWRREYPRSSGTAQPQERRNYHDLYPCPKKYVKSADESAGYAPYARGEAD